MTASSRHAKRGKFGAILVALAVTAAAWQTLSRAAAYLLTENETPHIAIILRPWDENALTHLTGLALNRFNGRHRFPLANNTMDDLIEQLAKTALETKPLDPLTLRLLAQLAESKANSVSTQMIMEVAGQQTIRDGIVDAYLLYFHAAQKDYAGALARADALLRIKPALTRGILPIVDSIAVNSTAQSSLVHTLQSGPPWRGAFLTDIASKLVEPAEFLDVVLALKEGPHPLRNEELRAYLDPLIARDFIDQAYDAWLQFLPPPRLSTLRYVNNGNFQYPSSNLPFDWMITPVDGATITIEDTPDRAGRGLHIFFEGKRVSFRNVAQMLRLPVGRYRLSGSYRSMALDNPRGMSWRIYCAQRNDSMPIAMTERTFGTSGGWKMFETAFEVTSDRCAAQWLRLELAARVKIEESVAGSIWYDHIEVSKRKENRAEPDAAGIKMPEQPGTLFERAVRGP